MFVWPTVNCTEQLLFRRILRFYLFFELNLRNRKWLACCSYKPHKNLIKEHLRVLAEGIQFYSKDYENSLLMGDYNGYVVFLRNLPSN